MFRAGFVWYSGKNSGMIFTVNTDCRAYDASGSEKVVGIYGDAHCDPRRKAGKNEKGCMARQLQDACGDVISYEAIGSMVKIESDKMPEKQPSGKK